MARTFLTSVAALALCGIAMAGCGGNRTDAPPSAPETVAPVSDAVAETSAPMPEAMGTTSSEATDSLQTNEQAPRIRTAIREFITETYPKSEVEGIWVLQTGRNYCVAGADTVISSRHRNIDVLVRQYVREDGSSYWRCEGFGQSATSLLLSRAANTNSPDSGS